MTVLDLMYLAAIFAGASLLVQSIVLAVVCWRLVKYIRLASHESWVRDYKGIEKMLGIRKEEQSKDAKGHR